MLPARHRGEQPDTDIERLVTEAVQWRHSLVGLQRGAATSEHEMPAPAYQLRQRFDDARRLSSRVNVDPLKPRGRERLVLPLLPDGQRDGLTDAHRPAGPEKRR